MNISNNRGIVANFGHQQLIRQRSADFIDFSFNLAVVSALRKPFEGREGVVGVADEAISDKRWRVLAFRTRQSVKHSSGPTLPTSLGINRSDCPEKFFAKGPREEAKKLATLPITSRAGLQKKNFFFLSIHFTNTLG